MDDEVDQLELLTKLMAKVVTVARQEGQQIPFDGANEIQLLIDEVGVVSGELGSVVQGFV